MNQDNMISYLMIEGYLKSPEIILAFRKIPRENFVLPEFEAEAYEDIPLPILFGQTISAPHMYAIMLELAQIKKGEKVLEIGTGSGYGAALLSKLVGRRKVYSIEVIPELAEFARNNLAKTKIKNVQVIEGNGNLGLPEKAPFDKIIVTAGAPEIPPALVEQLKQGGKIIIPVDKDGFQELLVGVKKNGKMQYTSHGEVVFVPLVKKKL